MSKTFRGDSDYKAAFERAVTDLIDAAIEDRNERIAAVQALIDEYISAIDEYPEGVELERLADYLLYEDLEGDMRTDKITDEYPILSERQMARRYERETSLELAEDYDTFGNNRTVPLRRKRSAKENRFVDKVAQMKNRKRKAMYKHNTSPGTVVSYNLRDTGGAFTDDFVDCYGIGERWADDQLSSVKNTN